MRLPAEWEPQEAIWLSWPPTDGNWQAPALVTEKWAEISALISRTQRVKINAHRADHPSILKALESAGAETSQITIYDHPTNDVWCRDHAPLFLLGESGLIATDWRFNGWGGQFTPYDLDDQVAQKMAEATGAPHIRYEEVLEGGAIETNGAGTLLTTEAVLLNPNRNPNLEQPGVEKMFRERLGITETLWLKEGIAGDDTGGHIDDIARFVSEDTVLIATDAGGINEAVLEENARRLSETSYNVVPVPMPSPCEASGWRLPILPATYLNFLITNETVLVPTFQQPSADERALGVISQHFPTREVIGIHCLDLIMEGGALHCISMQEPLTGF